MKTLKLIPNLFSIILLISLAVIISSCSKNEIESSGHSEDYIVNTELDNQLSTDNLSEKQIRIVNKAKHNFGITDIDFMVRSNNPQLLENITSDFIELELGVLSLSPDQTEENQTNKESEKSDLTGVENGRDFIHVIAYGSRKHPTSTDEMEFNLQFSEGFNKLLEDNNAALIIDFGPDKDSVKKAQRHYWFWWDNKLVGMWNNNNGSSGIDAYWAFSGQTKNYWLHTRWFNHYNHSTVCCMHTNQSRWVRRIFVKWGNIKNVRGYWNYCYNTKYCNSYS